MESLRRWSRRLGALIHRRDFDREVRAELEHHLAEATRHYVSEGLDPAEARRRAAADLGGVQRVRQEVQDQRWGARLETLFGDVRYALRGLRRQPVFTATAVITIGLAIAINAVVFTVVRATLLAPLPYAEPDRIMRLRTGWSGQLDRGTSPAEFVDLRDGLEQLDRVGVYAHGRATYSDPDNPRRLVGAWMTEQVLDVFGVQPLMGRALRADDGRSDALAIMVAEEFWRRELSGSPDVVGSTIPINGRPAEIVGVVPAGFRLPEQLADDSGPDALFPYAFDVEDIDNRGSHYLFAVGRLRDGVTAAAATDEIEALGAWMVETFPHEYTADERFRITAMPLAEFVVREIRGSLMMLLGAVLLLLLVAAANVAGLLLSRGEEQAAEYALRAALGAGRGRIVTQVLAEALVLGAMGGVLGITLAGAGLGTVVEPQAANLPQLAPFRLDAIVAGFALGLAVLATVGCGIVALLQVRDVDVRTALAGAARSVTGRRSGTLRGALVTLQVGVAVVLLTGAALFTRSFIGLLGADTGYDTAAVITARMSLPAADHSEEAVPGVYRGLLQDLAGRPGIDGAGAVSHVPLTTSLGDMNFIIEGRPVPRGVSSPAADWLVATPGYFEALQIPLRRGRTFAWSDSEQGPGVVIINESFARTHWPEADPLGQRFTLGGGTGPGVVEVIGVVADVAHTDLDEARRPVMYLAHSQFRYWGSGQVVRSLAITVRSALPLAEIVATVREAVSTADPGVPLYSVIALDEARDRAVARPRLYMRLLVTFATAALLLAGVGTYGLAAYDVVMRHHELGIRMALGAAPTSIARMVLRQTGVRLLAGLVLGSVGSVAAASAVRGLLYEAAPGDPETLASVVAILALAGLAATWGPTRHALRTDPVGLLRT